MTRIRQFANDMGISYNKAKNLVQKGKKRKDGGSTILENTMQKTKMMKAADGKITKLRKETSPKAKMGNFRNIVNAATSGKITPQEAEKRIKKIVITKAMGGLNSGLKDIPEGNKGKGLSKLPTEVRNKMGFKKKGGTIGNSVKMRLGGVARGGGAATSGTRFKGVY
jgi:signal recognition particle subunit SEC65